MKLSEIIETVGDVELTEEFKRSLLKAYRPREPWKPKNEQMYWCILNGKVDCHFWFGDTTDLALFENGNVYKTEKEVIFAKEKLKVMTELKRYALKHNEEEIDWGKKKTKYKIGLHGDELHTPGTSIFRYQGTIYFTSEEIAENAIEEIGEERIKKYLFEIDEEE